MDWLTFFIWLAQGWVLYVLFVAPAMLLLAYVVSWTWTWAMRASNYAVDENIRRAEAKRAGEKVL